MKRISKELNINNLKHNLSEIKKLSKSKLMAVVKADAYGHGIKEIVSILSKFKIDSFAVATLSEALIVREINKDCEILIFGVIDFSKLKIISDNKLTITLLDYDYALAVDKFDIKVKAHIKVNTGMNRAGELHSNVSNIEAMYKFKNIDVTGIYSHLAAADSFAKLDIDFTNKQINNFDNLILNLRYLNINIGSTHLLASYGILNYKNLNYDYVRIGILLYGLLSDNKQKFNITLKPVMTLKSKVVLINDISANERISYGNIYTSNRNIRTATVSIGYADGLLRSLSNTNYQVLINGCLCPIIGLICMDQLIVDISNCLDVMLFDDVIIFNDEILASDMATKANTITNEVLSSLNIRE